MSRRLSKDEIESALEEENMATIYKPIRPDGQLTREEAGANTEFPNRKLPAPLTPDQLAEVRKNAQARPQHHTQSAQNAERAAKLAEQTEARRLAAVAAERAKKSK